MFNGTGGDADEERFPFDRSVLFEIDHLTMNHPAVNECTQLIDRFLFTDIKVKGSTKMFQDFVSEYFVPFFRAMLKKIISTGWCAIQVKKAKDFRTDESIMVPEVIEPNLISPAVIVNRKTLTYDMECYDYRGIDKMKNVMFLVLDGLSSIARPTMTNSVLSGIVHDHRQYMESKQELAQADFVRANPTIYLRADTSANSSTSVKTPLDPNYSDGGSLHNESKSVQALLRTNKKQPKVEEIMENASKNISHNIEYHQMQMENTFSKNARGRFTGGALLKPQHADNVYVCPPGMILANSIQLPTMSDNTVELKRTNIQASIYKAFGIPESILGAQSNKRKAPNSSGSQGASHMNIMDVIAFEAMLERYRRFFGDAFCTVYERIFKKRIDRSVIEFIPPQIYAEYIGHSKVIQEKHPELVSEEEELKKKDGEPEKKKKKKDDDEKDEPEKKKKDDDEKPKPKPKPKSKPTKKKKKERDDDDDEKKPKKTKTHNK